MRGGPRPRTISRQDRVPRHLTGHGRSACAPRTDARARAPPPAALAPPVPGLSAWMPHPCSWCASTNNPSTHARSALLGKLVARGLFLDAYPGTTWLRQPCSRNRGTWGGGRETGVTRARRERTGTSSDVTAAQPGARDRPEPAG